MSFLSMNFLLFLSVAILGYYVIPKRLQWVWLLLFSYIFYLASGTTAVVFILATTITTFLAGLILEYMDGKMDRELNGQTAGKLNGQTTGGLNSQTTWNPDTQPEKQTIPPPVPSEKSSKGTFQTKQEVDCSCRPPHKLRYSGRAQIQEFCSGEHQPAVWD